MAKLYAELTSDKGGRIASKSDDNEILATFRRGNKTVLTLQLLNSIITVHVPENIKVVTTKGQQLT